MTCACYLGNTSLKWQISPTIGFRDWPLCQRIPFRKMCDGRRSQRTWPHGKSTYAIFTRLNPNRAVIRKGVAPQLDIFLKNSVEFSSRCFRWSQSRAAFPRHPIETAPASSPSSRRQRQGAGGGGGERREEWQRGAKKCSSKKRRRATGTDVDSWLTSLVRCLPVTCRPREMRPTSVTLSWQRTPSKDVEEARERRQRRLQGAARVQAVPGAYTANWKVMIRESAR